MDNSTPVPAFMTARRNFPTDTDGTNEDLAGRRVCQRRHYAAELDGNHHLHAGESDADCNTDCYTRRQQLPLHRRATATPTATHCRTPSATPRLTADCHAYGYGNSYRYSDSHGDSHSYGNINGNSYRYSPGPRQRQDLGHRPGRAPRHSLWP